MVATVLMLSGGINSACLLKQLQKRGRYVVCVHVKSNTTAGRKAAAAARKQTKDAGAKLLTVPAWDLRQGYEKDSQGAASYFELIAAGIEVATRLEVDTIALAHCGLTNIGGVEGLILLKDATACLLADAGIVLETPFIGTHKTDLIAGVGDFRIAAAWSCETKTAHEHCGYCEKCKERIAAFPDSGVPDVTKYSLAAA